MLRILVVSAAIVLALAPAGGSAADPSPGTAAPGIALIDALSRVPDVPDVRQQLVSYVDYRQVETTRPGAAQPSSYAELEALRASEDVATALWNAAYMGIASGSSDLLRWLFAGAGSWPTLLGFDFFDVDREIFFGSPPGDGLALLGRFDPDAVARAFAARDYTATEVRERTLLCGPGGCDSGLQLDLERRDPGNPFGGQLGRLEPLAVSTSDLLSSASGDTVRAMLAAADGTAPSLASDPAYRAAAEAVAAEVPVTQATLIPSALVGADVVGMLLVGGEEAKARLEAIAATFEPIPPPELIAFSDAATSSEQIATIALVYRDAVDARRAADVVPERLETMESVRVLRPIRDLLDERGVGPVAGQVWTSADGSRSVAVITLRAPLPAAEPDPGTGTLMSSSLTYRMLVDMLTSRDTMWLAPELPELP